MTQAPDPVESSNPPRPNLGPEPWPESPRWPVGVASGGVLVAMGVMGALWWRRRKRAGALATSSQMKAGEAEESPVQRLVGSSELVRAALIGAFGPSWGSRTTEEIAHEPALLARVEPAEVERLVSLLRAADRVKFAGREPDPAEDWGPWAASFVASLAAGATSSKSGK